MVLGLVLCLQATAVWAAATDKEKPISKTAANIVEPQNSVQIGGKTYTRGQIVADFLRVAFSDRVWNDDLGSKGYEVMLSQSRRLFEATSPWFDEFFTRPQGLPKSGVINKWPRDITIGIDWPAPAHDTSIYHAQRKNVLIEKGTDQYYEDFERNIMAAIPDLVRATGRSVHFIDPKDPRDNAKDYARIRIVPTKQWVNRNLYMPGMRENPSPLSYEPYLQGGVLFGSSAEYVYYGSAPTYERLGKKMDGYLLPESNNNLGLVICKIDPETDSLVIKALISECLVRAMGLPEISKIKQLSVLGTWRNNLVNSKQDVPTKPTPYDLYMVSLLYCSDIKQGMSRNDVITVFREKKCITTGENHGNH